MNETKHRGWTIYIHEKLGVVIGMGAHPEGHETRIFEKSCIQSGCTIAQASEAVCAMVKVGIDEHIKADEDAAAEAKKAKKSEAKAPKAAPGKKKAPPKIDVSLF